MGFRCVHMLLGSRWLVVNIITTFIVRVWFSRFPLHRGCPAGPEKWTKLWSRFLHSCSHGINKRDNWETHLLSTRSIGFFFRCDHQRIFDATNRDGQEWILSFISTCGRPFHSLVISFFEGVKVRATWCLLYAPFEIFPMELSGRFYQGYLTV